MKTLQPLPVSALYSHCDSEQFDFTTTETLEDIAVTTGQERARDSIHFGIAVNRDGFNVFALGSPGTGKFTAVREMIAERALEEPVPPDWCYVNNFEHPHQPIALQLPGGDGARLHADMAQLVEELGTVLPAAFDNEDTHARMEEIEEEFREHRTDALKDLRQEGQNLNIAVLETPVGFTFAPIGPDNESLRPDQYEKLPEEEQKRIEENVSLLQTKLQKLLAQFQAWRKDTREKTKALYREIAEFAVGHLIDELRKQYAELPAVLEYLDAVQEDIVGHVSDFLPQPESPLALGAGTQRTPPVQRYSVNLLVDNSKQEGAPVVYEDLPGHANLIGRVEHQAHMGTLLTDFTLIKPGALHRANGGYLMLDARRVLLQPFAWESLKRVLRSDEIRIESLERSLSLISTVAIEPEPIPLDVKVVLVGDRMLYYLLYEYDPEFRELFKVSADFEDTMDRSDESETFYAKLIGTLARREKLRPLDRQAVARTIEHCARITGDSQKLSTHLRGLDDLLSEADHWAGEAKRDVIERQDIECAIDKRIQRSDRVRDRIYEAIERGTIMIDTEGTTVGQVNALSVLRLGDFEFGQPSRITATARIGEGEVVDIQREVELGGPIHSKGVLILSPRVAHRESGVRAVLRHGGRRQRVARRALRADVHAFRNPHPSVAGHDRLGESARTGAGHRRRQREDRGLLRCLQSARARRRTRRHRPRRQRQGSDAARRGGDGGRRGQVRRLRRSLGGRGHRAAHRRGGGRSRRGRRVPRRQRERPGRRPARGSRQHPAQLQRETPERQWQRRRRIRHRRVSGARCACWWR
jgi:predicted ATP-dependent protease